MLNGIQGLDDMRSKSVPQLSSIELLFKPGTDLLRARQLVQERIATVSPSLPTWAAPPVMLAPVSATGRAMQIGMTSKDHSLIEMSMTAYWTIRARLLRVPGVANVAIWNERLQLMTVQAEPTKMQARQVSLEKVMEATADAVDSGLLKFSTGAVIGTGGTIETPNQRIGIRNVLPIITPADLAKVPVTVEPAGGAARRRREGGGGPPAADRRRDHRRPAGAAARGGEAPLGEQPADDGGGRGRDPAARSRGCPGSRSTPRCSSRPTSSSSRSPT